MKKQQVGQKQRNNMARTTVPNELVAVNAIKELSAKVEALENA